MGRRIITAYLSPPDSAGLAHDAEIDKKIQKWLKKKGLK